VLVFSSYNLTSVAIFSAEFWDIYLAFILAVAGDKWIRIEFKLKIKPRHVLSRVNYASIGHAKFVRAAMSLLFTIFALVFVTELIAWIGKSVLLELVRLSSSKSSAHPSINFLS
jgi:hypothetical protein